MIKTASQGTDDKAERLGDDVRPPSDFAEYDRKWLERYRQLSFQIGLYTAIASATFFGMFSTFSKMLLDRTAGKNIDFHKTYTPMAMGAMMSLGVASAYASTRKEAQRQKLEDDRLAHRIVAGKRAVGDTDSLSAAEQKKPIPAQEQPSTYWRDQVGNRTENTGKTAGNISVSAQRQFSI